MALRQVVVGVDGSLSAVRALDRASEEAVLRGAALNILYAVPDADIAGPVLASSAVRVRNRHPGLAFTSVAVVDSPVRALLRHGQDAELTVVGSRGLGGIVGLVAGSVSRRLAARIRGPLLVVRGGRADPEGEVLLWPSGAADLDAAAFAFAEADFRGKRLHVLAPEAAPHVVPCRREPVSDNGPGCPAGREGAGVPAVGPPPGRGGSAAELSAERGLLGRTRGAALIVVGAHRARYRPGAGAGRRLLRGSHCPVVIVPGGNT
ncbi:universal stress protein [Streptomyces sp. NPDC060011]|uniref:universal stress protein n=1 Tax=unclassified Streptomyces TaxID=2593676 RepID=UPI00194200DC|nr:MULTISPECIES: universal stress protein [unclassified Streptomyces]MCX5285920.1 universal stress protein [Streptomyces sp. NBC_00198]